MALRRRSLKWSKALGDALLLQASAFGQSRGASLQRGLSKQASPPTFGIAFDIDGVLVRGRQPIDVAPKALQQLYETPSETARLRVPYVFLTNGGGTTEADRAIELGNLLGVPVSPDQVLLGHTPFKRLVDRFGNNRVLAVGKGEPGVVLKSYGFQHVASIDSYVTEFDGIDALAYLKPWVQKSPSSDGESMSPGEKEKVAAVFVVSDPLDWGRELQVLCDVLRSDGEPGVGRGKNQTPIFFAADDLEYQAAFPVARLGMGAFRIALESIYNELPLDPMVYTTYGKPHVSVYKYAEAVLQQIRDRMVHTPSALSKELMHGLSFPPPPRIDPPKLTPLKTIYMIGDNPLTDIKGAKDAGAPWFSILTRSGVYQGEQLPKNVSSADVIVDDVKEAIHFISEREGLQRH